MTIEQFNNDALLFWAAMMGPYANGALKKLIQAGGSLEGAYFLSPEEKKNILSEKSYSFLKDKLLANKDEAYQKFLAGEMKFASIESEEYPHRLRNIVDPPYGIFYYGELRAADKPSCAIIGARDCSEYGKYVACEVARELVKNEVTIISGMARGIDGESQRAALMAGGYSIGILGSGADICYPSSNRNLYESLKNSGCVMSAFPPGELAKAANFPIRNRYVSALADVVLVVEARLKSGTLITVDCALEQGKEVYAVPGRVTDRLSDGCNKLIDLGAGVFTSPESFSKELCSRKIFTDSGRRIEGIKVSGISETHLASIKDRQNEKTDKLDEKVKKVYLSFDEYPKSLADICKNLGAEWNPLEVNLIIQDLLLEDYLKEVSVGFYCVAS